MQFQFDYLNYIRVFGQKLKIRLFSLTLPLIGIESSMIFNDLVLFLHLFDLAYALILGESGIEFLLVLTYSN